MTHDFLLICVKRYIFMFVHLIFLLTVIHENFVHLHFHSRRISVIQKRMTNASSTHILLPESHTRTVVRECCKGDEASQWRNPKFDPPPRPNPVTDRNTNRHTWLRRGPLHLCNSSLRSAQAFRFVSAHAWLCAPKCVSFFFGFLRFATAKGRERILTQNTPKHAVPPKDVPFRGREHKI